MGTKLDSLQVRVGASAGGALLTAWLRSTRSEIVEGAAVEAEYIEAGKPAVFVLWHGRLLSCAFRHRDRGIGTLISRNRDGDFIAPMVAAWGYEVIRGSSSRGGGAAMREIVRMLRTGRAVALTPDGPRGPRQRMKIGPIRAAMTAGVPLIPAAAGATRGAYFGGWDRFLVPAPFSWCPFAFGEPIWIDPESDDEALKGSVAEVERALNELTSRVDEAARARRA